MKNSKFWLGIEIFAGIIFFILLAFFIKRKIDDQLYLSQQNEWQKSINPIVEEKEKGNWIENRNKLAVEKVEKVRKEHPAVIAIIEIPGTGVFYPIVQGEDNHYYLNHDKDGNYHAFGEIFLDSRSQMEFKDQNSIIYGHNIRQAKTLFNELLKYKDQDFYEQHKYVNIYSLDGFKGYEVIQAFVADPEEPYREIVFSDKGVYLDFLEKYNGISLINTNFETIKDKENKNTITLSTCFDKKTRMVLQAIERVEE